MPTQAERRATTRHALLDAATATLVQRGAGGFTTTTTTTTTAETATLSARSNRRFACRRNWELNR